MLNIRTTSDNLNPSEVITDVESAFLLCQTDIQQMPIFVDVIKHIDKADYLGGDVIKNRFGTTSISKLSTGCKALLLALYLPDKWIDFLEVGPNVINYATHLSSTQDIKVIIEGLVLSTSDNSVIYNGKEISAKDLFNITNK